MKEVIWQEGQCVWRQDPGSVLLHVCARRQQCWTPRSADEHHIHKSRAEEGGETCNLSFTPIPPILAEHSPQLITGIVTPW